MWLEIRIIAVSSNIRLRSDVSIFSIIHRHCSGNGAIGFSAPYFNEPVQVVILKQFRTTPLPCTGKKVPCNRIKLFIQSVKNCCATQDGHIAFKSIFITGH